MEQLDGTTSINSTTVEEKDQDNQEEIQPSKLTNIGTVEYWPKLKSFKLPRALE